MKIYFSKSIASSLLKWFLFIAIVPLLIVAWYAYDSAVVDIETMQRKQLEETSAANAEYINNWLNEAYRDLDSWAQNGPTQEYLRTLETKFHHSGKQLHDFTSSGEYQKLLESHDDHMVLIGERYDYVYDLFLIDLEGNILFSVAKEPDLGTNLVNGIYQNTKFAQSYRAAVNDKKAHFSDLEYYSPSKGAIAGFICVPMRGETGEMVGIMAMQLNLNSMVKKFSSSGSVKHYLVGYEGLLRTPISDEKEILRRRVSSGQFWKWYNEHGLFGASYKDMKQEAIFYQGPSGKRVLGQHHGIEFLGVHWAQITEVDASVLREAPNDLAKKIAFIMGFVIVLIVLLAVVVARRIVRPITLLSEAGEKYISGIQGVRVRLDATNEIGGLGEVFNRLLEKREDDRQKLDFLAKKSQKALDELKEQKYALDAHSIVAITDVRGTITFVNTKFEEITGYKSSELLGKNHRILNSGLHGIEFWKEMYHAVSGGVIWHGEVCNLAKDGHPYWVDTTIVPFMGEDGKPQSYIAIRTDITQRKQIQDSLNNALALQKAVFENAGVSIITTDTQGLITSFNGAAEAMLGYTAEEMVGKQSPAIVHKLDEVVARAQELTQELGELVEPGFRVFVIKSDYNLSNTHEWTYVRKDGRELPVYLNITALCDANGNVNGYMGIASDITLFKEAEAQMIAAKEAAEASVRVKSEFLATMSHEIRTPMNGVLGMLGLLEHTNLDETQKHQVRVASNSANSLLGLINDILDFSKVEAGKMELEMIEFNLRDELGEFVEAIAFRAQEKGLELILDTTSLVSLNVITDPGRLRQILTNLIGNAVKFTHRGEVLITVMLDVLDEHNGRLRIDVRDSGIGIAADKIDHLFQTFSQADTTTTRKYGGTGLGLAIVKQLCELMGGTVGVTSVEYEGSTFHVDILVGLGAKSEIAVPRVSVEGKSVLVVDDNETNRTVVRAQLQQWGMVVYEAEDPMIAFDYCRIRIEEGHIPPYDVALLDMQMPNMDGADLGEELRAISQCDDMKMIMMTSLGHRNDAQRFAKIGFDAFFAKPTTTRDLLNALKVLFDRGAALEAANPLITKDFLGALQDEASELVWPLGTRILLVEDNPTNQIVAQGMLGMIGLQADVANNGLEALVSMQLALKTTPYTIVLMDCQMPEMDGYAASSAIRAGEAGADNVKVPIVAMTANAMSGDREKCMVAGMDDYITKPINVLSLKSALAKWLLGGGDILTDTVEKVSLEKVVQLPIWDESDALNHLGNNSDLLRKIIESFMDEGKKALSSLRKAMDDEDSQSAQLHAHSLKGSAGNIGALKLQTLAKQLEEFASNGDIQSVEANYSECQNVLNETLKVLERYLVQEVKPMVKKRRLDALQMAIKLQELQKELEEGRSIDTDATKIFAEYTDEVFTANMARLKEYISASQKDDALALLKSIMDGLG
jgi:PAS domain S-box-containing protein